MESKNKELACLDAIHIELEDLTNGVKLRVQRVSKLLKKVEELITEDEEQTYSRGEEDGSTT